MIRIGPGDTIDLRHFKLKWRWTDDRHANLSAEELRRIHPLTSEKAGEVCRLSLSTFDGERAVDLDSSAFERIERVIAKEEGRAWLIVRLPSGRVPIVVSWDQETAVLTDVELFTARWENFCYPSSDDVTVLPLDGSWVLHYWHEEEFLLGWKREHGSTMSEFP